MKTREPFADRIYRQLLRILPFDFRTEFETEMKEVFREQRTDVKKYRGFAGLLRMWWATVLDLFRMAPREHWSILSLDARYATRMMRKNPGFTLSAIFILGLGIGANTAIFSVVDSVLLKPLPYIDGERLVILRQPEIKLGTDDALFSVDEIHDYREQTRTLTNVVEYHNMTFTLFGKGAAHRVRTGVVSAEFFDVFGVKPLLGRSFLRSDEVRGAEPVLILSYEFWKQIESGDPQIIGRKYEMNDSIHTVIGVLPAIPQYPDENDVFMPTSSCPMRSDAGMMSGRDARMMNVFGRLKEGVTLEKSQAELTQLSKRYREAYASAYPLNAGHETHISLLQQDLTSRARPLLLLLWGAAGFVLLIACANVANLIMARMAGREQELLLRSAVGAGSGRLLRQLLTESFFLALFASVFGMLCAFGSVELMKDFTSQLTPRAREIVIDLRVLVFTMLCASITTIFFGSVAAIYSRPEISSGLKEGGRTGTESGSNFVRKALITVQVAFSCILLIGAGLMVRSFIRMIKVNPGFQVDKVISARLNLSGVTLTTPEQQLSLSARMQERLKLLPGVIHVAVSSSFPLDEENALGGRPIRFRVQGDPRPESACPPVTSLRSASVDYFRALAIPLISGRTFLDTDKQDSTNVVVLNQALAVKHWGMQDPVGKRMTYDNGQTWLTIIGVVGNVKEFGLNVETPYQIYRPQQQAPFVSSVVVRTALGDEKRMAEDIRRVLQQVEPRMAVVKIQTMEQAREKSIASPRTLTHLFSVFGVLAFVIAIFGIASMLSLWVKQRTRETGIRMALGATPHTILATVIRQGMVLAGIGTVLGLAGALVVTRMLATLLFQIKPDDAFTYALAATFLLIAALLASYAPARRAARLDPQTALHSD